MNDKILWIALLGTLLLLSCAQTGSLTGGDKDETPPALVEENSTPNYQTNFKPGVIKLTFNEWVNLKSGPQNIIISPLLNRRPAFKLVGKQLQINFSDEVLLEENTTYQIQLLDAISDLTEKNPAEPISFIFSTGDVLDSLTITGKIETDNPEIKLENVQVMLYQEWLDTTFQNQRASYIVKTDSASQFTFTNLPNRDFTIVAFDDGNKNGIYDPYTEAFGFLLQQISPADSSVTLNLFLENRDFGIDKIDTSFADYLQIEMTNSILDMTVDCGCPWSQDLSNRLTLYNQDQNYPWVVTLHDTITDWRDTITVYTQNKTQLPPEINGASTAYLVGSTQKVGLGLVKMEGLIDSSLVLFYKDQVKDSRKATFKNGFLYWNSPPLNSLDTTITLGILPSQWNTDILSKVDTLQFRFDSKRYVTSILDLNITGLVPDTTYLVTVKTPSGSMVKRFQFSAVTEENKIMTPMIPGTYIVEVVQDDDHNGKWTSGSSDNFIKNEKIWFFELPQIRLNWDLEHEVNLQ